MRNVVFAANFLMKLAEQKKLKEKNAVSPNSAKTSQKDQDSDKKAATAFGISNLMGNFFKVSQNLNNSP